MISVQLTTLAWVATSNGQTTVITPSIKAAAGAVNQCVVPLKNSLSFLGGNGVVFSHEAPPDFIGGSPLDHPPEKMPDCSVRYQSPKKADCIVGFQG